MNRADLYKKLVDHCLEKAGGGDLMSGLHLFGWNARFKTALLKNGLKLDTQPKLDDKGALFPGMELNDYPDSDNRPMVAPRPYPCEPETKDPEWPKLTTIVWI